MHLHWKRCPIRAKLCCCLLGFLLLTLSALLVLGSLLNHSMDHVDKRLQTYYNITAFGDAFTAADHELEDIVLHTYKSPERLTRLAQLRHEADACLTRLAGQPADGERGRLADAIADSYAAYTREADILLSLLPQATGKSLGFRYFGGCAVLRGDIQEYIPELLILEISRGQAMYADSRHRMNRLFLRGLAAFAALHMAAVALLMYLINRAFLAPIRQISAAMERLEAGDFETPDLPVRSEDEIAQLVTVFNTMKHSTRALVAALREKNELERELHRRAKEAAEIRRQLELARYAKLRSQVNPHFLFNTLNTISRVAREEQAPATSHLIISLARLFRYSLDTDAPHVTLAREMKCVDDYMRIQSVRFGDRLRFSWRVDPLLDPNAVLTVPYTLQPFVENAVIHGLRDTASGGLLRITLRLRPAALQIDITDNGCGMSRAQLERLQAPAPPGDDHHIGIGNVRCRLLHFRPESRLRIFSCPGCGTCVRILIPRKEGYLENIGGGR